jgi:hypothetical protein
MMRNTASSYREEHESFVSNLKGSSVGCILACLMHIPAYVLLLKLAQRHRKPRLSRDYCLLVFPLLLTVTVFANHNYWSITALIVVLFFLLRSPQHSNMVNEIVLDTDGIELSNESVTESRRCAASPNISNSLPFFSKTNYITTFKGSRFTSLQNCHIFKLILLFSS